MWCYDSERCEKVGEPKPCWLFVWYDRLIKYDELLQNEKIYILRAKRTVKNEEDKTSFSLGHSAESFFSQLVCQTSWHSLSWLSTPRNHSFSWKQVQETKDWGGSATGPGAAGTAVSFMGSGVSGSLERRSIKFRLRHAGVSSAVKELPHRSSPERVCLRRRLSPSSSTFVFVTLGCRQL